LRNFRQVLTLAAAERKEPPGEEDSSRAVNEFARMFLRKYAPQRMPPKQVKLSPSAQVLGWETQIPPERRGMKTLILEPLHETTTK